MAWRQKLAPRGGGRGVVQAPAGLERTSFLLKPWRKKRIVLESTADTLPPPGIVALKYQQFFYGGDHSYI